MQHEVALPTTVRKTLLEKYSSADSNSQMYSPSASTLSTSILTVRLVMEPGSEKPLRP